MLGDSDTGESDAGADTIIGPHGDLDAGMDSVGDLEMWESDSCQSNLKIIPKTVSINRALTSPYHEGVFVRE